MRLLIIDDHVLFREGLAAIIRAEADIDIVGLAGTVQEAIELEGDTNPDIILMDFELPDGTGVEATQAILSKHPDRKIVFLTIFENNDKLLTAIRSGAKGYLLKNIRPSRLVDALRAVMQGESALSPTMTLRVMEELARTRKPEPAEDLVLAQLTPREVDVLGELGLGFSNQEIAERLFLSENTIRYHVHSILEKLNLPDRKEAGVYARQHGLVKK